MRTIYASLVLITALPWLTASAARALEGLYDGPWFQQAEARIEKHRMADLQVAVRERGEPVEGASVHIEMVRHAFPFGSAVTARRLVSDDSPDGRKYRLAVRRLFNRVVFENDLKWPAWEGEWGEDFDRRQTLKAIDWLDAHGITVRGHCLVWPGWKHLPESLKDLDDEALAKRVGDHVREAAGALRGRIVEWDVVNETFWNHDLQDRLGREAMADWFRLARAADPDAGLFINDARIVGFGGNDREHQDYYFRDIEYLVASGAPIDGIGLQAHFRGDNLTPPERALAVLDRFASFGLDLGITEFDVHTDDEERQARYLHDFMHIAFSHPAVTEFIMWGFWEGQIYKPPRALYREDWTPKPCGRVYEHLVLHKWWTRAEGKTSGTGLYGTRGFLGEYRVRVVHEGREQEMTGRLGREGLRLEVELAGAGKQADSLSPPSARAGYTPTGFLPAPR